MRRLIKRNFRTLVLSCIIIAFLLVLSFRGSKVKKNYEPGNKLLKPLFKENKILGNFEGYVVNGIGPGENGKSHRVTEQQKDEEQTLINIYGFNQLVSDEISLDRSIPDTRDEECKYWDYPDQLPAASVILIFHNEGWSTLLRSVHSVINRTPAKFLHEVVLVDDKSELEHLHERLDEEIKKPYYQGKVKLVRNKEREGLIRSRNNGAIAASGEVLVFLDAHCEVGKNWLPPLLSPIAENPRTLSVPIIDGIDWNDFSIKSVYQRRSLHRGIFEWGMLYKEGPLPQKEADKREHYTEPYNAPTHAGGLFAIRRSWFKELGWYDPGLQIWGGENYELSFKVWQCGGRSVWVPCSHIGHVYRGHSCSSCHSGGITSKWGGVPLALRNYKRLVETWFDEEQKNYFYTREPLAKFIDMGDISKQLALKEEKNCKPFSWFMREIAYDVFDKYASPPSNDYWGEIKNFATNLCVDTASRSPPSRIMTSGCHGGGGNQLFRLNIKGQLASGEWCIIYRKTADPTQNELGIAWCEDGDNSGPWKYEETTKLFLHLETKTCLTINSKTLKLNLSTCDKGNSYHLWHFDEIRPSWIMSQYIE